MYDIIDIDTFSFQRKMQQMFTFISRIGDKISEVLQYPIAWLSGLCLFFVDAMAGGKIIIYTVLIVSIIDLICGIGVAIHRKRFVRSELMRQTVEKLVVYGSALFAFLCLDKLIEDETSVTLNISAGLVGVIITLTEIVSFLASLLILFPNNPFLKLMQKALTGEIARKLGCEEEDVKAILNASRKRSSIKRDPQGRFKPKHLKSKSVLLE